MEQRQWAAHIVLRQDADYSVRRSNRDRDKSQTTSQAWILEDVATSQVQASPAVRQAGIREAKFCGAKAGNLRREYLQAR